MGQHAPGMGGASASEGFTKSILAELKGLEPGGPAPRGRGRASCLSAGEPSPAQEGLGTLCQSQEIIMSEYTSWVSSQSNSSKILSEKRAKVIIA